MTLVRRRYTTVRDGKDYLVSIAYNEDALDTAHWFEAKIEVKGEKDSEVLKLPRELATYRVGETERPYRDLVRMDFAGDREAALGHLMGTICRRIYAFIERGH